MMKRESLKGFSVLAVILSLLLLAGCAKPPTEEMLKAEKAIAEAKQKEADLYVEDVFTKAAESLKKSKDLVAVKKYKEARAMAEETVKLVQQAISMVETNKTKMKTEAEKMIQDVQGAMDELKTMVAKAVKKKAQINREAIQGMIGKWEVDMINVKEQIQAGKIRQAYDQLKSMKEQVKSQREGIAASLEAKAEKK